MRRKKLEKLRKKLAKLQARINKHERGKQRHGFALLPNVREIRAQLSGRFEYLY